MQRKTWLLGAAIAGGSLVIGVVVGVFLMKVWTRPLAPSLPTLVPTATQGALPTQAPTQVPTQAPTTAPPTSTPAPTNTPTPTPAPMCGGPASMNILAIGTNRGFYDLADVIRVIRVDFVTGDVYVVPLPRDLKVDLPPKITTYPSPQKLNEGYFLGTPVWQWGAPRSGGAALLAQTLSYNFGITTDHYVVVSGRGFRDLVDAVGGIQIYLPAPVVDPGQAHANFPAGPQTLDGYHTWLLARIRKNVGDPGRIERQNMILQALLDRVTSPAILPRLPEMAKLYSSLVMTDLSPQQISQLICLLQKMDNPKAHFHFYAVPRDLLKESAESVYAGQVKNIRDVLLWDERYKQWLHDAIEGKIKP